MFNKQKLFYTPLYADVVKINPEYKEQLIEDLIKYADEDIPIADGDERIMNDGRKGYYSTAMTFVDCDIPSLKTFVLALQDKVQQEIDNDLFVADFGFNIHQKGTYQTLVNNPDVEYNGNYILKCGPDNSGINMSELNGEYRLVNPNTFTKPIYHPVQAREDMFFVWPGSVMWEMLPNRTDNNRISIQLYIERLRDRNEQKR